jgi:hypothetical protein
MGTAIGLQQEGYLPATTRNIRRTQQTINEFIRSTSASTADKELAYEMTEEYEMANIEDIQPLLRNRKRINYAFDDMAALSPKNPVRVNIPDELPDQFPSTKDGEFLDADEAAQLLVKDLYRDVGGELSRVPFTEQTAQHADEMANYARILERETQFGREEAKGGELGDFGDVEELPKKLPEKFPQEVGDGEFFDVELNESSQLLEMAKLNNPDVMMSNIAKRTTTSDSSIFRRLFSRAKKTGERKPLLTADEEGGAPSTEITDADEELEEFADEDAVMEDEFSNVVDRIVTNETAVDSELIKIGEETIDNTINTDIAFNQISKDIALDEIDTIIGENLVTDDIIGGLIAENTTSTAISGGIDLITSTGYEMGAMVYEQGTGLFMLAESGFASSTTLAAGLISGEIGFAAAATSMAAGLGTLMTSMVMAGLWGVLGFVALEGGLVIIDEIFGTNYGGLNPPRMNVKYTSQIFGNIMEKLGVDLKIMGVKWSGDGRQPVTSFLYNGEYYEISDVKTWLPEKIANSPNAKALGEVILNKMFQTSDIFNNSLLKMTNPDMTLEEALVKYRPIANKFVEALSNKAIDVRQQIETYASRNPQQAFNYNLVHEKVKKERGTSLRMSLINGGSGAVATHSNYNIARINNIMHTLDTIDNTVYNSLGEPAERPYIEPIEVVLEAYRQQLLKTAKTPDESNLTKGELAIIGKSTELAPEVEEQYISNLTPEEQEIITQGQIQAGMGAPTQADADAKILGNDTGRYGGQSGSYDATLESAYSKLEPTRIESSEVSPVVNMYNMDNKYE